MRRGETYEQARDAILDGIGDDGHMKIWRRTDPDMATVMRMQGEGLVTCSVVQIDEQSSYLKVEKTSDQGSSDDGH